jgi:hypothetical protein
MPQIFAASGYEEPWGPRDQIRGQLDVYRVRSRADIGAWGQTGMDTAAGSKNGTGADFLSGVVNGTVEGGQERVCVPVELRVSVLDVNLVKAGGIDGLTYQIYL